MDLSKYNIIDLTHSLDCNIPSWDANCGFEHKTISNYTISAGDVTFQLAQYSMPAGIGTHIDAPSHCIPGGASISDIELNKLIAPCICIDVSDIADENFKLSVDDIKKIEAQHNVILDNSIVVINTGWSKHWGNPNRYRNDYQFPSISQEAAKYLLEKNINGIAIDTLSPDTIKSGFPVHELLLGNNKFIIENVAAASQLPPTGATIFALPLKVSKGPEASLRMVALTPKETNK